MDQHCRVHPPRRPARTRRPTIAPRVVSRPPRSKDLLHVTSPQVCDHTAMATLIGVVATLNTIPAADEYDTGSTVFARKPSSCESTLDVGRSRGG